MQEHYLEHLFTEYKNCLHNEFEEYIGLEDEYKSYYDKCWKQKNDISNLYNSLFANHTQTNPEDQMWYQQVQIDKYKNQFMRNGWNARQTEN